MLLIMLSLPAKFLSERVQIYGHDHEHDVQCNRVFIKARNMSDIPAHQSDLKSVLAEF